MSKDNLDEIIHSIQETNRRQSNLLGQNQETLTRIRAANKMLRAELERQRLCARDNWRSYVSEQEVSRAWCEAHRQLAEAGKAK